MTWLSALSIGFVVDVLIAALATAFYFADKAYQAEKLVWLRAEGLYRPDSEHP